MTENNHEHWKCVEITLPYFKQGDDIDHYIDQTDSLEEALEIHAEAMDAAANQLRRIKEIIGGREVSISGMTHMIFLESEPDVVDRLVEAELAKLPPDIDDDDEPEVDHADSTDRKGDGL